MFYGFWQTCFVDKRNTLKIFFFIIEDNIRVNAYPGDGFLLLPDTGQFDDIGDKNQVNRFF
jgi:hypothetical protein